MSAYLKYLKLARDMGAEDAILVESSDIVFDPRTYIKCMYGCGTWGKAWTCPSAPGALKPWETEKILKRYSTGLLIHCHDRAKAQEIAYRVESEAFVDGHYFAFGMSDCSLCEPCACELNQPCRFYRKARPSMHAMGIDVYATVRRQGLPLEPLKEQGDQQNWYSLVMFD